MEIGVTTEMRGNRGHSSRGGCMLCDQRGSKKAPHSRQPPPLDIRRKMHRSCLLKRVNTALRGVCQVKSSRSKVEKEGGEWLGDEWSGPEVHSHIRKGRLRRRKKRSQPENHNPCNFKERTGH